MKSLKYIKLFEKFESNILSKTLGYINKESRSKFLNIVKVISESINFPMSKLSDDYFEYLPFNKALKKSDMITDEPCTATSEGEFPGYGIPGESCNDGKIKRRWGKLTRNVKCPTCGGTGIKPKRSGDIKLLKIWFDKEGNYITQTAVDGLVRKTNKDLLPQDKSSYKKVGLRIKPTGSDEVSKLKTGQYVKISHNGRVMYGIILVDYHTHVIQPYINKRSLYRSKINGMSIDRYGGKAFVIDDRNGFDWLEKVDLIPNSSNVDPYSWNIPINISWGRLNIGNFPVESDMLKNAHFAIIIDYSKLKKSDYMPVHKQREIRSGNREGATALISDKDIKSQNIARYIDKLSKSLIVSDDIKDVNKVINKISGGRDILFMLRDYRLEDDLSFIIEGYLGIMRSEENIDERIESLNVGIESRYSRILRIKRDSTKSTNIIIKSINEIGDIEHKKRTLDLFNSLRKLSSEIYGKIKGFNIEDIEDIEILNQMIISIYRMIESNRYSIHKIRNFFYYFQSRPEYSIRYIENLNTQDYKLITNDIELISKIIKKM